MTTPEDLVNEGNRLGLVFNGYQSRIGKPALPMFTGKDVGTFMVGEDETVESAYNRKLIQFGLTPHLEGNINVAG